MEEQEKVQDKNKNKSKDNKSLPKELDEIIKYIPADKQKKAIEIISSLSITTESIFSGPLPPPSILKEYNNTVKDGAERIMKMAEHQSNHRIELEKHAIKEELNQSSKGQKFGFILAIIGLLSAVLLAILGHDTVAGIFASTTIIGLVTVFVIGKRSQKKEIEE